MADVEQKQEPKANKTKDFFSSFGKNTKEGFTKFGNSAKETFQEVGQKMKDAKIDEKFKEIGAEIKTKTSTMFKSKDGDKIFGVELLTLLNSENRSVPIFLSNAKPILIQRKKTIGIFRTSPDFGSLQTAIKQLESNHAMSLESTPTEVICSLIKQFFRQLESRILTEENLKQLSLKKEVDPIITYLLENVKIQNLILLLEILEILDQVNKQNAINMMNANNLAIIFAPNFIPEEVGGNFQYIETFEWLINNYEQIHAGLDAKKCIIDPNMVISEYSWGLK